MVIGPAGVSNATGEMAPVKGEEEAVRVRPVAEESVAVVVPFASSRW